MRIWLKELRNGKHLSRVELAKELGIAPTTLSGYELGTRDPSVDQAKAMAEKLNIDWTIFLKQGYAKSVIQRRLLNDHIARENDNGKIHH